MLLEYGNATISGCSGAVSITAPLNGDLPSGTASGILALETAKKSFQYELERKVNPSRI